MESRTGRKNVKKRKWPKVILLTVLILVVLVGGAAAYEYLQLKPTNHFKAVSSFNTNSKVAQKQGTMNILLLGSDERKGQTVGHSDSIILMHVDFNTNKVSAVSIPRDTRVHLVGYGYTKLTSVQYITQATKGSTRGIQAAANSINELTGVPINYYVESNYLGLQSMVDTLGSIEVNVPFDVKLTHPWYPEDLGHVIKAGPQTMDGKMVAELTHERYSLQHGDYGRQLLQEKVLIGIAKTGLEPGNITKLPALVQQKSNFIIGTNMSNSDLLSFGMAMKNINPSQITYYQIKGSSQLRFDDILKNNNQEIVLDKASLDSTMQHFK
jgi:polyisoprenyl-teichoic acid--peptidoglycan teichoic acid transferase